METVQTIRDRHSVRVFSEKPIPRGVLEQLVDAGRLAPTARMEQPWTFVVITDHATLKWLGATCDHGPFIAGAAACIAVICLDTKYYLEDGCAATENILLAATALGVGSCWVAGDKKPYGETVLSHLGVPSGHKLVSLIPLGYEAKPSAPKGKKPLAEVLRWGRWS